MNFQSMALALSFFIFSGCASGYARFDSPIRPEKLIPIKKILVLTNAKSEYFNDALNTGFESSFSKNLTSCGLDLLILPFTKKDNDTTDRLKRSMREFAPDALMSIKSRGGKVVRGVGGNECTLYFDLEIVNSKDARSIWKARLEYNVLTKNMFSSDQSSGENMGMELYERLILDKVLYNCKSNKN